MEEVKRGLMPGGRTNSSLGRQGTVRFLSSAYGAAKVGSRWGRWVLGAGAPPSLLYPPPPAPPTTLVVPCACARRHWLPNIASSPPPFPPLPRPALRSARAHDSLTTSADPRDPKPLPGPARHRTPRRRERPGSAARLLSGGCKGEAGPTPACRFLISCLLDPPVRGGQGPVKRSLLWDTEVRGSSLRHSGYNVENERVAATEPKSELESEEKVFQKEVYLHISPHLKAEPDKAAVMTAESLPFSFGTLSSWELEAWYEDLQEVLSSDENAGACVSPPGNEEEESKTFTTLDPASLAWLTEEPGPADVIGISQSPCSPDSTQSSLAQEEEEEDQGIPRKRKRSGQSPARAGKQRMKDKEQENERKAAQLAEENERLKQEIERLTREVEATRRALIDRMVNLHQV